MTKDNNTSVFVKIFHHIEYSFNNIKRYIIYGDGDYKTTLLQNKLLEAFIDDQDFNLKLKIEKQLKQPFKISFYNDGRINPFYFKNSKLSNDLLIDDPAFSDRLYNVEMFVDGRKEFARVTFFEGRIFSLEFKRPSKFYAGKEISFGAVTIGKSKQSLVATIDRAEHGKDGKIASGNNGDVA